MTIKFNKKAKSVSSSDPMYDLFYGGYLDDLIKNSNKSKEIKAAVKLISEFIAEAEEQNLLELE